ncbi:unnamed protein product, partial [marine sediment metagenome]
WVENDVLVMQIFTPVKIDCFERVTITKKE